MQAKPNLNVLHATTWVATWSVAMIGLTATAFAQGQAIPIANAGFENDVLNCAAGPLCYDSTAKVFRRADTQRLTILRHVVEETLAKRKPSEQSIRKHLGIHAEERDEDDPTVRVEVREIRKKLDKYYREHGLYAGVNITIPKGKYIAELSVRNEAERLSDAEKIMLSKAQAACDKQTFSSCAEALEYLEQLLQKHKNFYEALSIKTDVHLIRAIQGMPPIPELELAEPRGSPENRPVVDRRSGH